MSQLGRTLSLNRHTICELLSPFLELAMDVRCFSLESIWPFVLFLLLVICSLSLYKDKATNPSNRQEDWEYIIGFCDQINKELEGWVSQTTLDLINYSHSLKCEIPLSNIYI